MTVKGVDSIPGKSAAQDKHFYFYNESIRRYLHRGIHSRAVPNKNDEKLRMDGGLITGLHSLSIRSRIMSRRSWDTIDKRS
jgi:hypothetical protein